MAAIEPYIKHNQPDLMELLKTPSDERLPAMKESMGQKQTHEHITVIIQEFCNEFNVVRPMTPNQIVTTAFKVMTTALQENCSLVEIATFFEVAKSGSYGRILDRLDGPLVMSMLEKYLDERWEFIQGLRLNDNMKFKQHNPPRTGEEKLLNNETMQILAGRPKSEL